MVLEGELPHLERGLGSRMFSKVGRTTRGGRDPGRRPCCPRAESGFRQGGSGSGGVEGPG